MTPIKTKHYLEEKDVKALIQEYWETLETSQGQQAQPMGRLPRRKAARLKLRP